MKVRRVRGVCKHPPRAGRRTLARVLGLTLGATLLPSCQPAAAPRTITVAALESAPPARKTAQKKLVVPDAAALQRVCYPLGSRLGLLQVRSAKEWELVARAIPQIGPCPDLTRGALVGLACWTGTPVDGAWPVSLAAVRVREGAGLLEGDFHPGTYLPDGTAYLETAYVPGLRSVLIVDVSGTTFYPD